MPLNYDFINRLRTGLASEAVRPALNQPSTQTFAQNFRQGTLDSLDRTSSLLAQLGNNQGGFGGQANGLGSLNDAFTNSIDQLAPPAANPTVAVTPFTSPVGSIVEPTAPRTADGPRIADIDPRANPEAFRNNPALSGSSGAATRYAEAGTSDTGAQLRDYGNGQRYSDLAIDRTEQLLAYVNSVAGPGLSPGSGYRSDARQRQLYDADLRANGGSPSGNVARPGTSAHRSGNAIDFGVGGGSANDPRLLAAAEYARQLGVRHWLHRNCCGSSGYHVHIDFGTAA